MYWLLLSLSVDNNKHHSHLRQEQTSRYETLRQSGL